MRIFQIGSPPFFVVSSQVLLVTVERLSKPQTVQTLVKRCWFWLDGCRGREAAAAAVPSEAEAAAPRLVVVVAAPKDGPPEGRPARIEFL